MNDVIKTLIERRSVRSFEDKQISDEDLDQLLEVAQYAPTGAGTQATIFIAVQNPEVKAKLTKLNADVIGKEGMDPYYGAPTIIEVLASEGGVTKVEDGSIALANLYNAAESLGLGSCWIHRTKEMFESEEGKALLKEWGFEGEYVGVGALIVGYKKGDTPKAAPRKPNRVKIVK
jgi:nitroreductase